MESSQRRTELERAHGAGYTTDHHPALVRLRAWSGTLAPGWDVDFLGVKTRLAYFKPAERLADRTRERVVQPSPPIQNEDYFEWIDLLESVFQAKDCFRMVELGAGWGKWITAGAVAARRAGLDAFLIGVEAEPTHFEWMRRHLVDNDIDLGRTRLVRAAVAAREGTVRFLVGDAAEWYGQKIEDVGPEQQDVLSVSRGKEHDDAERRLEPVPAITLRSLLAEDEIVDLIDSDIQGAEAEVFEAAGERLTEVVRRVHIGTHSDENEERLRTLFHGLGWECRNDYPGGRRNETPYGLIPFQDGVQTWVNPHL